MVINATNVRSAISLEQGLEKHNSFLLYSSIFVKMFIISCLHAAHVYQLKYNIQDRFEVDALDGPGQSHSVLRFEKLKILIKKEGNFTMQKCPCLHFLANI